MRNGFYTKPGENNITIHSLVTEEGIPKGIKTILFERGIWDDSTPKKEMTKDAGLALLLQQDDFSRAQLKSHLVETMNSLGVWIDFYPKFHPEMNFIEMYWGYVKRNVRLRCRYDFEGLKEIVPICLDEVPMKFIRRAARKCFRYIDAYGYNELSPQQVGFAFTFEYPLWLL